MPIIHSQSFHKTVPSQGKLLGIDVGTKRIGLAMSDETRLLFTPTKIIVRKSNEKDFAEIKNLCVENKIVAIVIGFPINMDSTLNDMSQFVKKFATALDEFLGAQNIFFADERLTSFAAKDISHSLNSRRKEKYYDDIAASVILQDFVSGVKQRE